MNQYPTTGKRFKALTATYLILPLLASALYLPARSQGVTGIITDYGGFWKTSTTTVNPIKPDNSHNLLAFTWNGTQYATGANNPLLTSRGETYVNGDWWSMNIYSYTGSMNDALIALGQMYDGVDNGASTPPPSNANFTDYLRDGIKGLDLGTGISNLPSNNSFTFFAHSLNVARIGDGVPDILITQFAQPGTETYEFLNSSGVRVGNAVTVNFNSVTRVANWTIDFYNATSMALTSSLRKTERELRLWAADLSLFGINSTNAPSVARFRIHMSGASDFAFSAYNNQTIVISNTLPVTLKDFRAQVSGQKVELNWSTLSESSTKYFIVEKSRGTDYLPVDTIKANGQSAEQKDYRAYDPSPSNGTSNYRLRIVDNNGSIKYSQVVPVFFEKTGVVSLYPNPTSGSITILHPAGSSGDRVQIFDPAGRQVLQQDLLKGKTFTSVNMQSLARGVYHVTLRSNGVLRTEQVLLQ
ncbi:T9SS type A sorting domain-containing protein [Terrimonas sp. NA20]|uniref:T9SS type A sorting domain-containing protein n=1 Tax=Terrimonas ginsenosidimutans TaxID=2908004 RepID=A0ABS9L035_9BACT|nr:T9SS type A sorting domain-containing protein [Terrimonas ginsenosidimutans]MCG2617859.1 T9SS type A sorting domain-containing protein [Terrimonas ginsenosidimutans]